MYLSLANATLFVYLYFSIQAVCKRLCRKTRKWNVFIKMQNSWMKQFPGDDVFMQ